MNATDQQNNIEERLNRTQRELNVLYEVSCAMRATLELNHILYIILTGVTAHSGLGFNRALLYLVNKKNRSLECKMVIGPESGEHANRIWTYMQDAKPKMDDLIQAEKISQTVAQSNLYQSLKGLKFPLEISPENPQGACLLTIAYQKATPWTLPPTEILDYAEDPLFKVFRTEELIIVPLKAKDEVNGLIVADNPYTKKPITPDDIKIFTMLANQAGLAVENSQLYEMVVQKSHTDPVTQLWNHGFFQEQLTQEMDRARPHHSPLSLAMIDIDDFKKLNDTYGHQQGDLVLRDIARILKEQSRETDFVCRYGGEEFSVILIHSGQQASFDISERLRTKIADHTFTIGTNQVKITVSIGVAAFPTDAQTKEELINQADKAMYIAKFSGKNRTCLTGR